MRKPRNVFVAYVALGSAALGFAGWLVIPRLKYGDVDPVSAGVGIVGLAVSVGSLIAAVRALRQQQITVAALERLAAEVRKFEERARMLLLGAEGPIDVPFVLMPASGNAIHGADCGRLSDVADYYKRLRPRRMVITGDAGSGKTVLAIELILALLEKREQSDPVPVRLPATSLDSNAVAMLARQNTGQDVVDATEWMRDWLTDQLTYNYRMPPASARFLVDAGLVVPVIDGLDELDAVQNPRFRSRAGDALRLFNAYQHSRGRAALIIACRTGHYTSLSTHRLRMHDAARIELQPVTLDQSRHFIVSQAHADPRRWRSVTDTLTREPRGLLARTLSTPWRLKLATAVYNEQDSDGSYLRHPRELIERTCAGPNAIRDHLVGLFISYTLRNLRTQRFDPEQSQQWLSVLAGYLANNSSNQQPPGGVHLSGMDIVLHDLWSISAWRKPLAALWTLRAVALVAPLTFMLILTPIGLLPALILILAGFVMAVRSWGLVPAWRGPQRITFKLPLSVRGLCEMAAAPIIGCGVGTAILFTFETVQVVTGVCIGVAVGAIALLFAFVEDVDIGAPDPRSVVRDTLAAGLTFGSLIGTVAGLVVGVMLGPVKGIEAGIFFFFGPALIFGLEGWRYLAMLVATHRRSARWLPWRLGRFLDACCQVGVLRIAGGGYQFRHRELQNYLTDHPHRRAP